MWSLFKKKEKPKPKHAPNPHLRMRPTQQRSFFSTDVDRVLTGWDTDSYSIDHYLKQELTQLVARSRSWIRGSSTGKRFVTLMKSNVVGPDGFKVNPNRTKTNGKPDSRSNKAVETAYKDWAKYHCDYTGKSSFTDLVNIAVKALCQDGEFIFEKVQTGKYSFQLKAIDSQLLDIDRYEETRNGGEIRLGIEYNSRGEVIYYHFRKRQHLGDYRSGQTFKIRADRIIHGYLVEDVDQSRGYPWNSASLEDSKHLKKYKESAIVNARASANTFNVISSDPGDEYQGDEDWDDGDTTESIAPGETRDIGHRTIHNIDPDYPHQMYDSFVKSQLRDISSGLGVSYHSLANDLEGVNFSSIRSGTLEDRELFKQIQNWLIRIFIEPVFKEWVNMAYLSGQILLPGGQPVSGPIESYEKASFQGRRWAWVDPQKDMAANKMYIDERLKSRSQIMREQGDDPEAVWNEIAQEEEMMSQLGIQPIPKDGMANGNQEEETNAQVDS